MGEMKRRLQVQRKLLQETKLVQLNPEEICFTMSEADREQLSRVPGSEQRISPEFTAARILISQAVQTSYPDGMDRKQGKLWAGWQEVLSGTGPIIEVTQGQMEWLRTIIAVDNLKLPIGMAQWREALCDYLDGLAVSLNQPSGLREDNG